MDADQALKHSVLDFIKYLKKQKLKEKPTILDIGQSKMRVSMFRSEGLFELTRNQAHIDHIAKIFKPANIDINNQRDIEQLLDVLVRNKHLMKLDRAPTKLKTPNYKWPKTMLLNQVGLIEPKLCGRPGQLLRFCAAK